MMIAMTVLIVKFVITRTVYLAKYLHFMWNYLIKSISLWRVQDCLLLQQTQQLVSARQTMIGCTPFSTSCVFYSNNAVDTDRCDGYVRNEHIYDVIVRPQRMTQWLCQTARQHSLPSSRRFSFLVSSATCALWSSLWRSRRCERWRICFWRPLPSATWYSSRSFCHTKCTTCHTRTNMFLTNLAVSDMILVSFILPHKVHDISHTDEYVSDDPCRQRHDTRLVHSATQSARHVTHGRICFWRPLPSATWYSSRSFCHTKCTTYHTRTNMFLTTLAVSDLILVSFILPHKVHDISHTDE